MELDHEYLKYYTMKDGDLILDIGATGGEFAKDFLDDILRTDSMYVAVEPEPHNITYLASFLRNKLPYNSILVSKAVTDKDGKINLRISSSYLYHSTSRSMPSHVFHREIEVDSIKLDTLIKLLDRDISFLKCDVEGEEVEIFSNFSSWDKLHSVCVASYHELGEDRIESHNIISPIFRSNGFEIIVERGDESKGFSPLNLLYAWR